MTALNPQRPRDQSALVVVLALAAALVGLFAVGGAYWLNLERTRLQKGWRLVPVVVAAVDVPANAVLGFELLSQRSVPDQFVTASVVTPDRLAPLLGQRVKVPLLAGDLLLWSHLESAASPNALVAARDLGPGAVLADGDLVARVVPAELLTASWVDPADRPGLVGQRVAVSLAKGDPVLWSHFDRKSH